MKLKINNKRNYLLAPLIIFIFFLIVSGCTTTDIMYNYDRNNTELLCHGSCITTDEYLLGFVEFDDEGYYHDVRQRQEVFDWIKDNIESDVGAIIVSFTHGWFHNANNVKGGNRQEFSKVLRDISNKEKILTAAINSKRSLENKTLAKPRKIIGIYTGWRGESVSTPIVKLASFWERKNIAKLIGARDGKDYFSTLDAIKNELGGDDSRLVIVGHSFGGLLVHSATTGLIFDRFNQGIERGDKVFSGIGDMVVLINPAFEALDIGNLLIASNRQKYVNSQRPFFMVLASEADKPTNLPFRFGRFFTTFFDNYTNELVLNDSLSVGRKKADTTAIGHYKPFRTHTLSYKLHEGNSTAFSSDIKKSDEKIYLPFASGVDVNSPYIKNICAMWDSWKTNDTETLVQSDGSTFNLSQNMKTGMIADKHNPFQVISVSKEILPGHSVDGAKDLLEFVSQMVVFKSAPLEVLEGCES